MHEDSNGHSKVSLVAVKVLSAPEQKNTITREIVEKYLKSTSLPSFLKSNKITLKLHNHIYTVRYNVTLLLNFPASYLLGVLRVNFVINKKNKYLTALIST